MDARPVIEVVCALLTDTSGRLLVARRPAGKHLAGLWEFPGGKVEPGETPEQALRRELTEELGCVVRIGEALTPVRHDYATVSVRLIPWMATLAEDSPAPVAREHDALRWVEGAELATLPMPAADEPIVTEWLTRRTIVHSAQTRA